MPFSVITKLLKALYRQLSYIYLQPYKSRFLIGIMAHRTRSMTGHNFTNIVSVILTRLFIRALERF